MAFGMMVRKWGILRRPLQVELKKINLLEIAIRRLHKYFIDKRIPAGQPNPVLHDQIMSPI